MCAARARVCVSAQQIDAALPARASGLIQYITHAVNLVGATAQL
jgi:hypothetical protein